MKQNVSVVVLTGLLILISGCGEEKVSQQEEAKMKDALTGKNAGEMPEETRRQMEEAMRKGMQSKPGSKDLGRTITSPAQKTQ